MFEITQLSKTFHLHTQQQAEIPVVSNVGFAVQPGECVALTGESGSGKSTVIRLLCRLYEPQEGRILLDGRDIRSISTADLRRQLGVVLQDTFLFSGNVADNLRLDAEVSDEQLQKICSDLGLDELLSPSVMKSAIGASFPTAGVTVVVTQMSLAGENSYMNSSSLMYKFPQRWARV